MYLHVPCAGDSCLDRGPLDQYCCFSAGFPGAAPGCVPAACAPKRCVPVHIACGHLGSSRTWYFSGWKQKTQSACFCSASAPPGSWLFITLEIVETPWLQTGSPGTANPTEGPLLPAALGRDAAETGKTTPALACEELEPFPSGRLAGSFSNTWGFCTVTCWSNLLYSLFSLYSKQGNVLPWSTDTEVTHSP